LHIALIILKKRHWRFASYVLWLVAVAAEPPQPPTTIHSRAPQARKKEF